MFCCCASHNDGWAFSWNYCVGVDVAVAVAAAGAVYVCVGVVVLVGVGVRVLVGVKVLRAVLEGAGVLLGTGVIVGVSVGGRTGVAVFSATDGYSCSMALYQSMPSVRANSVKRAPP